MKKYLLGAFAVVLAVGFSAFTSSEAPKDEKQVTRYLVYIAGDQTDVDSYQQLTAPPACTGSANLCAIRIVDNNGTVTQSEFDTKFATLDVITQDGNLNNETEAGDLLKKS